MTDVCWEYHKNNSNIIGAMNCMEYVKSEKFNQQEAHLEHVCRTCPLQTTCGDTKHVAVNLHVGQTQPCSMSITTQYSFDFAKQVHYPSDPLQPGPIYFITLRKCGFFGVCCEGGPQQVNYLSELPTVGGHLVANYRRRTYTS